MNRLVGIFLNMSGDKPPPLSTTAGVSALFGSASLLTMGRAPSHLKQSFLVRAIPSSKALGARLRQGYFRGHRGCLGEKLNHHHFRVITAKLLGV